MPKLRIAIPAEGLETVATMLDAEAPATCGGIREVVQVDGKLVHEMMPGNETLIELEGKKKVRIDPENWVYNFVPGDVLYWHSQRRDGRYLKGSRENAEIAFVHVRHVKLRDLGLSETAANHFATIDSRLDEFAAISKRIRFEGAKRIVVESAQ